MEKDNDEPGIWIYILTLGIVFTSMGFMYTFYFSRFMEEVSLFPILIPLGIVIIVSSIVGAYVEKKFDNKA